MEQSLKMAVAMNFNNAIKELSGELYLAGNREEFNELKNRLQFQVRSLESFLEQVDYDLVK